MKKGELTTLIASLSQAEKRYFTAGIGRDSEGGSREYLRLFRIIDQQLKAGKSAEQTDNYLSRQCKTPREKLRLADGRHYLAEALLESLQNFHRNSRPSLRIQQLYQQAEVLLIKAQYQMALDRIAAARKLANQLERLPDLLSLAVLETAVLSRQGDLRKNKSKVEQSRLAITQAIDQLSFFFEINHRYADYFMGMLEGQAAGETALLQWAREKSDQARCMPGTFVAQGTLSALIGAISSKQGNHRAAADAFGSIILQYEKASPALVRASENRLQAALYNYFNALSRVVSEEELQREMDLRMSDENASETIRENLEINYPIILSNGWISHGRFENVKPFRRSFEALFRKFDKVQKYRDKYYHAVLNTAVCFFAIGEGAEAKKFINRLLGLQRSLLPLSLTQVLYALTMLIDAERGDAETFFYHLRAFSRLLREPAAPVHPVVRPMLKHLERIVEAPARQRKGRLIEAAAEQAASPVNPMLAHGLDWSCWLESRIKGISYAMAYCQRMPG